MSGTKRETPPTPTGAGPGSGGEPNPLMVAMGRGTTPAIRAGIFARGLIQQAHMAHKVGDDEFGRWEQRETPLVDQYCLIIQNGTSTGTGTGRGAGGNTGG